MDKDTYFHRCSENCTLGHSCEDPSLHCFKNSEWKGNICLETRKLITIRYKLGSHNNGTPHTLGHSCEDPSLHCFNNSVWKGNISLETIKLNYYKIQVRIS